MTRTASRSAHPGGGLLRHASVYGAVMVVQGSAALLVLPLVTRAVGAKEYGIVAVATALMQMLAVVSPLGLTSVVAWDIFERREGAWLRPVDLRLRPPASRR